MRAFRRFATSPTKVGLAGSLMVIFAALTTAACGNGADNGAPVTPTNPSGHDQDRLVRADSPILGPADAPVTLVEFLDPECESCRAAYPVVKELLEAYPDELRLVVRYFPLHGNSVLAALATEAAGEQGKYEEMQAVLFERQPEWGEQKSSQEARFVAYAEELGLDRERFLAALRDPKYIEKVERDRADGIALGVRGTPTFFVNGDLIAQPGFDPIKSAIEQALE